MNNLYAQLKISPRASLKKIERVIARCSDPDLRAQATRLLLNPENKQAYDQTHQLLTRLGILKARLKIRFASNYDSSLAAAYYHRPRKTRSQKQEFFRKLHLREKNVEELKKWGYGLLILLAVLIYGYKTFAPPAPRAVPAYREIVGLSPRAGPPRQPLRYHTAELPAVPVVIKTPRQKNYFIKFEAPDGRLVSDIYIDGGETIEINLPENYYVIKYAQGSQWEGYGEWFGLTPGVKYKKIDNLVHFAATTPPKKYIINIETNEGENDFRVVDIVRERF